MLEKHCPDCGRLVDYDGVSSTVICGNCDQQVKLEYVGRAKSLLERWAEEADLAYDLGFSGEHGTSSF